MKLKFTGDVVTNLIMPVIVGAIVAKFSGNSDCAQSWLPDILPCWVWNFLIGAFLTAVILDILIYIVYPKIKWSIRRTGKFRVEPFRDAVNGFVGIRVFNNEDENFTERTAELIGYAPMSDNGLLN